MNPARFAQTNFNPSQAARSRTASSTSIAAFSLALLPIPHGIFFTLIPFRYTFCPSTIKRTLLSHSTFTLFSLFSEAAPIKLESFLIFDSAITSDWAWAWIPVSSNQDSDCPNHVAFLLEIQGSVLLRRTQVRLISNFFVVLFEFVEFWGFLSLNW
jgi:hypothetical protein